MSKSRLAPGAQRLAVIQTRSGLRGGQTRRGGAGQVSGSLERAIADSLRELDLPFAAARMASDPARTPPLSQVLAERAQVLVRISPSRDAAHPGAEEGYQGEHPLARLWRTTCLGPAIELWRMGR